MSEIVLKLNDDKTEILFVCMPPALKLIHLLVHAVQIGQARSVIRLRFRGRSQGGGGEGGLAPPPNLHRQA